MSQSSEQRPEALLPLPCCLPSRHCRITFTSRCRKQAHFANHKPSRQNAWHVSAAFDCWHRGHTRCKDLKVNNAKKPYLCKWLARFNPGFSIPVLLPFGEQYICPLLVLCVFLLHHLLGQKSAFQSHSAFDGQLWASLLGGGTGEENVDGGGMLENAALWTVATQIGGTCSLRIEWLLRNHPGLNQQVRCAGYANSPCTFAERGKQVWPNSVYELFSACGESLGDLLSFGDDCIGCVASLHPCSALMNFPANVALRFLLQRSSCGMIPAPATANHNCTIHSQAQKQAEFSLLEEVRMSSHSDMLHAFHSLASVRSKPSTLSNAFALAIFN